MQLQFFVPFDSQRHIPRTLLRITLVPVIALRDFVGRGMCAVLRVLIMVSGGRADLLCVSTTVFACLLRSPHSAPSNISIPAVGRNFVRRAPRLTLPAGEWPKPVGLLLKRPLERVPFLRERPECRALVVRFDVRRSLSDFVVREFKRRRRSRRSGRRPGFVVRGRRSRRLPRRGRIDPHLD